MENYKHKNADKVTEDSNSSSQRYKKQKEKIDCKITKKPGQGTIGRREQQQK